MPGLLTMLVESPLMREEFLGFVNPDGTTGETLANLFISTFEK